MRTPTERVDPRYSDDGAAPVSCDETETSLAAAPVAWIVTVRAVKHANLRADPHVLVLAAGAASSSGADSRPVVYAVAPSKGFGHTKGDAFRQTTSTFSSDVAGRQRVTS